MIFLAPLDWFLAIIGILILFFVLLAFPVQSILVVGGLTWLLVAAHRRGKGFIEEEERNK